MYLKILFIITLVLEIITETGSHLFMNFFSLWNGKQAKLIVVWLWYHDSKDNFLLANTIQPASHSVLLNIFPTLVK